MTALRLVDEHDSIRAELVATFLRQRGYTQHGERSARTALRSTAQRLTQGTRDELSFPWEDMAEYFNFEMYYQALVENIDPATSAKLDVAIAATTAERYTTVVIQLLSFFAIHEFVNCESWAATKESIRRRRVLSAKRRRRFGADEFTKMLTVASFQSNRVKSARDAAVLVTLVATGARRAEVVKLEREDLNLERKELTFSYTKGGGQRIVSLPDAALPYFYTWCKQRGDRPGPLFCSVLKSGRIVHNRSITDSTLYRHWKLFAKRAGLEWEPNPHDARRFFITELLAAGTDVFATSRLVGHRSPTTTQVYDTRAAEDLRHNLRHLPLPTAEDLEAAAEDLNLKVPATESVDRLNG